MGTGKNAPNTHIQIVPLGNDRGENGGGEPKIGSDGCKPSFHHAAPRTIRRRKRLGFMIMLLSLIVIKIILMMIMTLVIHRFTTVPR